MTDPIVEIAQRIQTRPWNRPGTDKSWVLNALWEHQRLRHEIRQAQPVTDPPAGRAGVR